MEITFRGWRRPPIGALVSDVVQGRAQARTTVRLDGADAAGLPTGAEAIEMTVRLAGPDDVAGLHPRAIGRRFPSPGTPDAETTKCPYVELPDPGLPWRYAPARTPATTVRRLRPWLVLLVGTPDEIELGPDTATLAPSVLRVHPLAQSHRWAHVQDSGGRSLARLLSPRRLAADTEYVAVLVPAYVGGVDAWSTDPEAPVMLTAFTRWAFRTGPGGDFRTLATRLHPAAASSAIGLAEVTYPRLEAAPSFSIRGALAPIGEFVDEPLPSAIRDDLAGLRTAGRDGAGRPIVGLPRYGAAWHAEPETAQWGAELNRDPRHRGVAGLGMQLGVEAQEELVDEALQHAGALAEAGEHVRDLALGLAAAGGLWHRRLPADPSRRLWLFGPALTRVVTPDGTADALATADDRPLASGWFSTATRRVLRRGQPHARMARANAADPALLNPAANRRPPPTPFVSAGLPDLRRLGAPSFEQRRIAVARGTALPAARTLVGSVAALDIRRFPRHAARLQALRLRSTDQIAQGRFVPWVPMTLLLTALGDGENDPRFDDRQVTRLLRSLTDDFDDNVDDPRVIAGLLHSMGDRPVAEPPSRPIDVAALAGELAAACDPGREDASARQRVLDRVRGIDPARPLMPPELCVGLDLPVWRHLAGLAPDWLLPGVGQIGEDVVIAVATNPVFVDAFLAGINTRLLEELRWRNLHVAGRCTPVRTFWQRADQAGGRRVDDIAGIHSWHSASRLGADQHRPPGPAGSDLVLVFRSRLFARYPRTLLYLVPARRNGTPDFSTPPPEGAPRTLPTFQGRLGTDTTFFGFEDVPADEVGSVWVALEEPPAGLLFRNDLPAGDTAADGAQFADDTFADPLRVLIRGDRLVPDGVP